MYTFQSGEVLMNSRTFFQYCRELVVFRWQCRFVGDEIRLVALCDEINETFNLMPPVCAVACDIFSHSFSRPEKIFEAAEALELSKGFSLILFAASSHVFNLKSVETEVRAELVDSLTKDKKFAFLKKSLG